MSNVVQLRGLKEIPRRAPKSVRSTTEAVILTKEAVGSWSAPPFQRPLRVNNKVMELAEGIKCQGGVLPGILTVGVLDREKYLVDGQHRVEAFKLSELPEVYAEVRICHFETLADMADEFVTLNSKLVTMRPDDILRGLEATSPGLCLIRKACSFVGYDMIRRGTAGPLVSMSAMLRCWFGSAQEAPAAHATSAAQIVKVLTEDDAMHIVQFLNVAYGAWRHDVEYYRLWGSLNLSLVMWLWRRTVLSQYSQKTIRLTAQQFGKCLLSLSASSDYLDWLLGRNLGERDRSPCYARIRQAFAERIMIDMGKKPMFPSPPWYHNSGGK
jgi:hypothetical protein